jgi:hypothetical protein
MADAMFMYGVTTGIFAFLVAVCFGARAAHKRGGSANDESESHSHSQRLGERRKENKKVQVGRHASIRIAKNPWQQARGLQPD